MKPNEKAKVIQHLYDCRAKDTKRSMTGKSVLKDETMLLNEKPHLADMRCN